MPIEIQTDLILCSWELAVGSNLVSVHFEFAPEANFDFIGVQVREKSPA